MSSAFECTQSPRPFVRQSTTPLQRAHLVGLLSLAILVTPASVVLAAKPVDAGDYQLDIGHRVLSQVERNDGKLGLTLALTLNNGGSHGLYDLRLFLTPAGISQLAHECAPARMRSLSAGKHDDITWTYECLIAPLPDEPSRELQFRVEAVDEASQEIVTFVSASQESR